MLGEDDDFTKRSIKANFNQAQNKNLFQINEDEEEEPFSPSKNNFSEIQIDDTSNEKRTLGENKNILNQSQNKLSIVNPAADYEYQISDPPQFCSYKKNNKNIDENMNNQKDEQSQKQLYNAYSHANLSTNQGIQSQLNTQQSRPRSQIKANIYTNNNSQRNLQSQFGLSDSTTILEGGLNNNNTSSKNLQLNGIEEEQQDIERYGDHLRATQTVQKRYSFDKNTPGKVELSQISKEESKDEDSSRILMMNNGNSNYNSRESLITNKTQDTKKLQNSILLIIIILAVICCLILSIGYVSYSFYNMTNVGLINALKIFGFSLLIDIFVLRIVVVSVYSIFTTKKQLELQQNQINFQNKMIDEDQIILLAEIYEDYQAPIQSYNDFSENYESKRQNINVGEDQDQKLQVIHLEQSPQGKNNNMRVFKFNHKKKNINMGELLIVESTYFYHQPQNMPLSEIKKKIEHQNIVQQNLNGTIKKKKSLSEKVDVSQTIQFNAEEIRLRKAHAEKRNDQDLSNYDIEEIPINSDRKEQQEYILNPQNDQEMNLNNISENQNRSLILPPILTSHHQFETPKGLQQTKVQFSMPQLPGQNVSQQGITFNDVRESQQDPKFLLRDLVGSSSSRKYQPLHGQEYQSIQRFLNEDKENVNSNNKSGRKSLIRASIGGSSIRHKKYLEDQNNLFSPNNNILNMQGQDEILQFTPQYNSLNKKQSITKDKFSAKNDTNRKSLALPDMFSDLKDVQLISGLNKNKKNSRKTSTIQRGANQDQIQSSNKKSIGAKGFNSPTSIKENLEERMNKLNQQNLGSVNKQSLLKSLQQPDISPFHVNIMIQNQNDDIYLEQPTMNMPSPRDFNILQSIDFNQTQSLENGKIRESTNSNLKQFLQPQLIKQKTLEKQRKKVQQHDNHKTESTINLNFQNETQNMKGQINSSIEDPVENNNICILKKPKQKLIKPKIRSKAKKEVTSQNTFQSENNSRSISNTLGQLIRDSDDQQDISDISRDQVNESKFDETYRSKMFEDSDQSTFRLISFGANGGLGGRKISKQIILSNNDYQTSQTQQDVLTEMSSQAPIDFYSKQSVQALKEEQKNVTDYKTQEFKKSKKPSMAEIIMEENLITHNSSPEKKPRVQILLQDSSSSNKSKTFRQETKSEEIEDENIGEFNLMQQMSNLQKENLNRYPTDESFEADMQINQRESNNAQPFDGKKQGQNRYKTSQLHKNLDSDTDTQQKDRRSSIFDSTHVNLNLKQQEDLRKKREDNEILMLRIEEQKRKLKNFLKLAKQLKSSKDEKKIKEFLRYLKEEQKPLPIKKINELKQLEIMSSPYNQSLIDMIKDEYDQFKNGDKKIKENLNKKPSKSQQRNVQKQGALINKLGGIYGQTIGNSSTQKKDGPKSRGDSVGVDFNSTKQTIKPLRNKLMSSRSKQSRESSNSTLDQQVKFKKRNQRNLIQVIEANSNQSIPNSDEIYAINVMNQIKIDNYGHTTSEDEENGRKIELIKNNNIIEILASTEFNDIQQYMGQ